MNISRLIGVIGVVLMPTLAIPAQAAVPVSTPVSVVQTAVPFTQSTQSISEFAPILVQSRDGDPERVGGSSNTTAAQQQLYADVSKKVSGNSYNLEGGGTVQGSNLLGTNGTISEAVYSRLDSKSQNRFINDMVTASNQLTDPSRDDYDASAATKPYDRSTVQNWFRDLQSQGGLGSQLLTALMTDVKPDIVSAHGVLQPFKGPMNTLMGIFAVLTMMFLGLSITLDIFYISIPFFQNMMDAGGQGRGGSGSTSGTGGDSKFGSIKLISAPARTAAGLAEEGKEPMWYYIKKRFITFLALGIALLYLVVGQLWPLVGGLIDLVSGTVSP